VEEAFRISVEQVLSFFRMNFVDPGNCGAHNFPNHAEGISQKLCMAILKRSFASTRHRFPRRHIYNYPGDEIPTRSIALFADLVRDVGGKTGLPIPLLTAGNCAMFNE